MSEISVHDQDTDDPYVLIPDAIGQGVDLRLYRNRSIISIVLVESPDGKPICASAEVDYENLQAAVDLLVNGR